jgi:putative sigma-54 modulation protein
MDINFTGHNIDITDPLRDVITRKFNRIIRHLNNNILSTNIILTSQKLNHSIEAIIHIAGAEINAKGTSDTMYKAIDIMISKLDKQIRRFKTKRQDRKKVPVAPVNLEEELKDEADYY